MTKINRILIVFGIATIAGFTFAESLNNQNAKVLTPQERSREIVRTYSENSLTKYKSQDDFYQVMKHYGFPNLPSNRHYIDLKHLDFLNPQSLKDLKKQMELINEREDTAFKYNRNEAESAKWKPKSKDQKAQKKLKKEQKYRDLEKFKKEIFYISLKEKLSTSIEPKVKACLNVDKINLGLLGSILSYDETQEIIKNEVYDLASSLEFDQKTIQSITIDPPQINCHALIDININELEQLNNSQRVSSFMSIDQAHRTSFKSS